MASHLACRSALPRRAPLSAEESPLNRDRRFDGWVRGVAFEFEVAVLEAEDVFACWVDQHLRGRARRAGELDAGLVEMVVVEMRVAEGVDEVAGSEIGDLRHHLRQQRVG